MVRACGGMAGAYAAPQRCAEREAQVKAGTAHLCGKAASGACHAKRAGGSIPRAAGTAR